MPDAARELGWGQRGTAGATIAARLAFESIRHVYPGGVEALRGVSLAVEPGAAGRDVPGDSSQLRAQPWTPGGASAFVSAFVSVAAFAGRTKAAAVSATAAAAAASLPL